MADHPPLPTDREVLDLVWTPRWGIDGTAFEETGDPFNFAARWQMWHASGVGGNPGKWWLSRPGERFTDPHFLTSSDDLRYQVAAQHISRAPVIESSFEGIDRGIGRFVTALRAVAELARHDGHAEASAAMAESIAALTVWRTVLRASGASLERRCGLPTGCAPPQSSSELMTTRARQDIAGGFDRTAHLVRWLPQCAPAVGQQLAMAVGRTHARLLRPGAHVGLANARRAFAAGALTVLPSVMDGVAGAGVDGAMAAIGYGGEYYEYSLPTHLADPGQIALAAFRGDYARAVAELELGSLAAPGAELAVFVPEPDTGAGAGM